MATPEWGRKHVCPDCETRFYDMARHPPACPRCGAVPEPPREAGRGRAAAEARRDRAGSTKAAPAPGAGGVGEGLEIEEVLGEDADGGDPGISGAAGGAAEEDDARAT